jgi:hypothetical protein
MMVTTEVWVQSVHRHVIVVVDGDTVILRGVHHARSDARFDEGDTYLSGAEARQLIAAMWSIIPDDLATNFEIGHKDGRVIINVRGDRPSEHFRWTTSQAREIARLLVAAADAVDVGVT